MISTIKNSQPAKMDASVSDNVGSSEYYEPKLLMKFFRQEWSLWLTGSVLSFFLASILVSGWPEGLIPDLSYPYAYNGDSLFTLWFVQRLNEGWFFNNPRSGFPFGSTLLDFPITDSGSILFMKLSAFASRTFYSATNLYFLLSFSITFIVSYIVLRVLKLNVWFSFAATALFVFLPFHFQRMHMGHVSFTWYFVVPLFFYAAFYLYYYRPEKKSGRNVTRWISWFIFCLILSSSGVYYAFFGMILLLLCGLAGCVKNKHHTNSTLALAAVVIVLLGMAITTAPSLINQYLNGKNPEVLTRSPMETEICGLKMIQMIFPRDNHRIKSLADIKEYYNRTFPFVNENTSATLGIVGTTGFLMAGIILLISLSGRRVESTLSLLTLIVIVLFLFGTMGGLSAVFSTLITPLVRSWNRISIFIGFGAIALFFLAVQMLINKYCSPSRINSVFLFVALIVMSLGLYDQTVDACKSCNAHTKSEFNMDKKFIQNIEHSLPKDSAIYQLPYMVFPETEQLNRLETYGLTVGFLHSKNLHWSYAGMKGREGDLFYRALSQESIEKQLEVIRRLGFSGVYIDRRGYADNAQDLIGHLTALIGPPTLIRADNEIVFFPITPKTNVNLSGLTSEQIMQKAGYSHKASVLSMQNFINQSAVYLSANKFNRAIALLKDGILIHPNDANLYNNLCVAYGLKKKYTDAISACSSALRIAPDFQLAKNNLAWVEQELSGS